MCVCVCVCVCVYLSIYLSTYTKTYNFFLQHTRPPVKVNISCGKRLDNEDGRRQEIKDERGRFEVFSDDKFYIN